MKTRQFHKYLILSYFLLGILLLSFYQCSARQDCISYLSITKKYVNGDFVNAVNGIWSPLISWLLIPFFLLNIPPLLSFKILQLFVGGFSLYAIMFFVKKLSLNETVEKFLLIAAALIFLSFAYLACTPDLLNALFLILYLNLITEKEYVSKIKFGAYAGLLGFMAYLAKAYSFPFFIAHFFIINFLYFIKTPLILRKNIIKIFSLGIGVFLLLSLPWIVLLSIKYGYITYSTASRYNFAMVGPEYGGKHLMRIEKLYIPPNATAINIWEDPTFLPYKSWNPFDSTKNFIYILNIIKNNIIRLFIYSFIFSPLLIFLIIFTDYKKTSVSYTTLILLLTVLIYPLGYLTLFLEFRFLIFFQILIVIISGIFLARFLVKFNFSPFMRGLFICLFFLSISLRPIYSLFKYINDGKSVYNLCKDLNENKKLRGNFASFSNMPLEEDWATMHYICFTLDSKFLGEVNRKLSGEELAFELKKYKINYFFCWNSDKDFNSSRLKEINRYIIVNDHSEFVKSIDNLLEKFLPYREEGQLYGNKKLLIIYKFNNE